MQTFNDNGFRTLINYQTLRLMEHIPTAKNKIVIEPLLFSATFKNFMEDFPLNTILFTASVFSSSITLQISTDGKNFSTVKSKAITSDESFEHFISSNYFLFIYELLEKMGLVKENNNQQTSDSYSVIQKDVVLITEGEKDTVKLSIREGIDDVDILSVGKGSTELALGNQMLEGGLDPNPDYEYIKNGMDYQYYIDSRNFNWRPAISYVESSFPNLIIDFVLEDGKAKLNFEGMFDKEDMNNYIDAIYGIKDCLYEIGYGTKNPSVDNVYEKGGASTPLMFCETVVEKVNKLIKELSK